MVDPQETDKVSVVGKPQDKPHSFCLFLTPVPLSHTMTSDILLDGWMDGRKDGIWGWLAPYFFLEKGKKELAKERGGKSSEK